MRIGTCLSWKCKRSKTFIVEMKQIIKKLPTVDQFVDAFIGRNFIFYFRSFLHNLSDMLLTTSSAF
jgi:hypothetical protein